MRIRLMKLTTLALIAVLVMAGTAIAANQITSEPQNQTIVIGEIGTYNITVETDWVGNHTISFDTLNDSLLANLTGQGVSTEALNVTGSVNWTAASVGNYTFTYNVQPQQGIPYAVYDMKIDDSRVTNPLFSVVSYKP